jgi:hypothetical protein
MLQLGCCTWSRGDELMSRVEMIQHWNYLEQVTRCCTKINDQIKGEQIIRFKPGHSLCPTPKGVKEPPPPKIGYSHPAHQPPLDECVWVVEVQARAQPPPAAKWGEGATAAKTSHGHPTLQPPLDEGVWASNSTAASRCTLYPCGRCRVAVVTQCVNVESGLHSGLGEDGDGLGVRWARRQQWRSIWETADATLGVSAGIVDERRVGWGSQESWRRIGFGGARDSDVQMEDVGFICQNIFFVKKWWVGHMELISQPGL